MGADTKIEWTNSSWTPIRARNKATGKIGWHCEHATTGCEFCYSEGMNKRLGTGLPFKPGHRKDIEIFLDEEMLLAPLRWKKPRMIFVCSMTDLFADFVPDEWIDRVFAVMALCPQHTFQVLTKRAERMRKYFDAKKVQHRIAYSALCIFAENSARCSLADWDGTALDAGRGYPPQWPLPSVWLGVSCERQQEADERIPHLLQTPAAIRFVSAEPLLGPIDLRRVELPSYALCDALSSRGDGAYVTSPATIDWLIVGGESGPGARPMHPDWACSLREQCRASGTVAFFFKQWGAHLPIHDARTGAYLGSVNVGKKRAGRLLDGKEYNAFPVIEGRESQSGLSSPDSKQAEDANA